MKNAFKITVSVFILVLFRLPAARASNPQILTVPPAPACNAQTKVGDVCSVPILEVHPTQFTLGMIEIESRTAHFEKMTQKKFTIYMKKHLVPTVIGPNRVYYMTDHHHLSLALYDAGVRTIDLKITTDWSKLSQTEFWNHMVAAHFVYLYDNGQGPMSPTELPSNILQMQNDIYRSLAWAVVKKGAIKETNVLFAKFLWADFFRTRIPAEMIRDNFEEAVQTAADLAKSPAANGLPGYESDAFFLQQSRLAGPEPK